MPQHEPSALEGADQPADVGTAGEQRPGRRLPPALHARGHALAGHRPAEPVEHTQGQLVERAHVALADDQRAARRQHPAELRDRCLDLGDVHQHSPADHHRRSRRAGRAPAGSPAAARMLSSTPASRTFSRARASTSSEKSQAHHRESQTRDLDRRCSRCRSRRPGSALPAAARPARSAGRGSPPGRP